MENKPDINKADEQQPDITVGTKSSDPPFVNEECGDTMWDDVLKEAEERLLKITSKKPDNDSHTS